MTPYTGSGGTLVLDDATQRAIQNGDPAKLNAVRPARAAVRPAGTPRRRPRRRGRHAEAEPRRHGQLHDAEARRRAALGRELRLQQRRRGGAPLRVAHQRPHHRHRVDEQAQHAARRLQRLVVRQPGADARLGQPAPASTDTSSAPGRGQMSLWPSNSAQTLSFGGYTKLAHKTQVTGSFSYGVRSNDEPLRALHDQLGAAADRAAARRTPRGKRTSSRPT